VAKHRKATTTITIKEQTGVAQGAAMSSGAGLGLSGLAHGGGVTAFVCRMRISAILRPLPTYTTETARW